MKIDHAGAASNANTPTGVTIVANSYGMNPNPTSDITTTVANGGGCEVDAATGIPGHNIACNVSYTYRIVGVSQGGGWSAPTAAVSTSTGPATLSTNNNLVVSWTGAANDIAYLIYSCSGASCTPSTACGDAARGRAGLRPQNRIAISGMRSALMKTSEPRLDRAPRHRIYSRKLSGVSGTSVTLSIAPAQTGIVHDAPR